MRTQDWWHHIVIYELYVDKFAGDFRGLTEKLDYFTRLGVTCLHILPHYPSPMVDDGYDVSDYRGVRPELGTLDDFRHFTQEAHARGIYIMVDCILNHVSDQHPWFIEARASRESTYRDFFVWSPSGTGMKDAFQPFEAIKPSNWIHDPHTNDYYYATFYPQQPDLNWNEPCVFEEMCAVIDFWVSMGVDAFRLDAAPHLIEVEGTRSHGVPETHALLKRLRAHIDAHYEHVALLAEACDTYEATMPYFGDGTESHLLYDFPLAADLVSAVRKGDTEKLDHLNTHTPVPPAHCAWVRFLRNHDELALGFLDNTDREQLLVEVDPEARHRFHGDYGLSMRLAHLLGDDAHALRETYRALFSLPGMAHIYYGDEIGMKNDTTIGTQKDTRRYVRGTFDWAEAERQMADPSSLFNFVASLARGRTTRTTDTHD